MTTTPELGNLSRRALVLGFAAGSLVLAARISPANMSYVVSHSPALRYRAKLASCRRSVA